MQQDFANSLGQENARRSVLRHKRTPFSKRVLKRIMSKVLLLSVAGFIGAGLLLSLLISGSRVDASVPITHQEWLQADIIKQNQQKETQKVILQPGDSAATALGQLGFPFAEVLQMSKASKGIYSLRQVRAGQAFSRFNEGSRVHIYYDVNASERLHFSRVEGEEWQAELQKRTIKTRQVLTSGTIHDSLFAAALEAGIDERTTMNLIDIFGWDIDFSRDLRSGDRFSVLYEEQFDDEGRIHGSVILAAEFVNQGDSYKAVRYELANGNIEYFTPEGRSMRKTYLKSPLKFSRISSRFSSRRKHPVLGYTRAHRGVDYAAGSGTPVRAVGNGTVVYSTWKGGYGRLVEIRHTNAAHSTAYAHLRSFGRGIKRGKRVKQGQIIGYVGMSGLATGPHLHFEFRVRGRAVNPLAVKHAPARPVPKNELEQFQEVASNILAQLSMPLIALNWE